MKRKDKTSIFRSGNMKQYFIAVMIFCTIFMVGTNGCITQEKFLTKERVYQICYQQLKSLGRDTITMSIFFEPEHPITIDSIINGRISTAWYERDYSEWLNRTGGKLSNVVFWKFECAMKAEGLDGIIEIYINAKSGEVVLIEGGGAKIRKWRKDHGLIEY